MRLKQLILAPALAIGCAPLALAQQEQTLPKVSVQDDGPAQLPVRSGTKTDTPLIDVPQAISVIDAQRIDDQGLRSMADVALYVPGLSMGQGEGHRDAPTLRGNASTADFFVDGVRDDVQYYRDFYNVERVEVLKGPNAMIFGRGGGGGVINRVTKQADFGTHRKATLQAGSFDFKRATVDVGQGLNDALALRVTAMYEDAESYRDFVESERYGVNPNLTWRLSDNTSLNFSVEHYDDQRVVDRGVPSQSGRPLQIDESTFFGNPDYSQAGVTATSATVTLHHNFTDTFKLRNHLSYGDYDKFYANAHANSTVSDTGFVSLQAYESGTLRQNIFNQTDVMWDFETGLVNHTLLMGVELGRQSSDNTRSPNFTPSQVNINTSVSYQPIVYAGALQNDNTVDVDVAAVYVQDQLAFGEHWRVIAGLRYDRFDMDFDNKLAGSADFSRTDNFVSPRLGVIFKPMGALSLYANYSVSYLPQSGDQFAALNVTTSTLEPEEFENIEVGVKWELTQRLALSAAVYTLERSNTPATDPTTLQPVLTGKQKSEGIELELDGSITDDWTIAAGYANQEAKITRASTAAPNVGRHIPLVPDHQASLWNNYRFSDMFRAGVGVVHQSEVFTSLNNSVRIPSFTRVDAALYVTFNPTFALQLNVENVLDKTYWRTAHNDNNITPGSPLAGRLMFSANF
jgi:catecholate siderophore receptor